MKSYNFGDFTRAVGWGALVGGGIGFALGILLAPEEGSRMRRRLSYHLETLTSRMSGLAEQVNRGTGNVEPGQHSKAIVAEARERAQEINTRMDEVLGEASGHLSDSNSEG